MMHTENSISDLIKLLQNKSLSFKEASDIVFGILVEVEMETVEEIMDRMPKDKRLILQELTNNKTDSSEVANKLQLNFEVVRKIELEKYQQILNQISPFLNL